MCIKCTDNAVCLRFNKNMRYFIIPNCYLLPYIYTSLSHESLSHFLYALLYRLSRWHNKRHRRYELHLFPFAWAQKPIHTRTHPQTQTSYIFNMYHEWIMRQTCYSNAVHNISFVFFHHIFHLNARDFIELEQPHFRSNVSMILFYQRTMSHRNSFLINVKIEIFSSHC